MPRLKKETQPDTGFIKVRIDKKIKNEIDKYADMINSNMSTVCAQIIFRNYKDFIKEGGEEEENNNWILPKEKSPG